MTTVLARLTNEAYGFPRGKPRRVKPVALANVHVTGNSRTAAYADLHAAAWAERNYANRQYQRSGDPESGPSKGPSAHLYVARDGWALDAVDADRYAAWSNGDVASPNLANPGIRRVLALRSKGYSANEAYWEEFELLGYGTSYPITDEQREFVAARIAARSASSGLPINRETVHGHWEINGVNRRNCPVPYAGREAFLADLIARAIARAKEPDMPGLALVDQVPATGFVRFKDDGLTHCYVQTADREYFCLGAAASRKPVVGKARLREPLDKHPGDRSTVWVVGGPGVEQAIALAMDVDDSEATVGYAAAVNAALEHVAGPAAAVITAIQEARP